MTYESRPSLVALSGPARVGKDTLLRTRFAGYSRCAFADELKLRVSRTIGVSLGHLERNKARYRGLLVDVAEAAREADPDIWVKRLEQSRAWEVRGDRNVVTDVRYVNEAQFLHDLGYEVWMLSRDGIAPANEVEARTLAEVAALPFVRHVQLETTACELSSYQTHTAT